MFSKKNAKGKKERIMRTPVACGLITLLCICSCVKLPAKLERPPREPAATEKVATEAEALITEAMRPWKGDLDGMVERRMIRVLTVHSNTFYFLDGARQRGATYEALTKFEDDLNKKLKLGALKVHVVFIPVSRDRLIPGLLEGIGDIAAANLTVTPERAKLIDFSIPLGSGVKEVVVTGPDSPPVNTLDDLARKEVIIRKSSSYYESLVNQNKTFKKAGKPEVRLTLASEDLEDEDILEMVNAGVYPMTVVDNHIAQFWKQIFSDITVHEHIVLRTGGEIAWAFRKKSPNLKNAINEFVKGNRVDTEFGNIIFRRYLKSTKYIKKSLGPSELAKLNQTIELFKKYAPMYDFDWLMIAAQAYQESGIDQNVHSSCGAVGVMQVLPATAASPPISITNVDQIENNIHAGVKYLRFIVDTYFKDPAISPVDRHLFAFASYNAGPNRIDRLRGEAVKQGLDPNKWFKNVEIVVARHIGRETTTYVGNIFKYYLAYKRIVEQQEAREKAKKERRGI